MRPNHLHMMVEAPGYQKLVTSFYPDGDEWLASDAVFGVKKSLVVVRITPFFTLYEVEFALLTLIWVALL